MSVQTGRQMRVNIQNSTAAFIPFAGLRAKALKFGAQLVDVSHLESPNGWRELLPGSGLKSAEISGAGVFANASSDTLARSHFFAQSLQTYQFILPDFGKIEGKFLISELSYTGSFEDEASFSLMFSSAGALTFSSIT